VIIVVVNAYAAAMIVSATSAMRLKEQDMLPSADAPGLPERQASAIGQYENELAALGLAAALGAAHVVCAQTAAHSRMQAAAEPTYQNHAKTAFLHAAARFLHQACPVLDPGANMNDWRDLTAGLIQIDTQPAIIIHEQAVLAEAMSMLASEAAALAAQASGPMAAVVRSVQACIGATAGQLREAELVARSADADGDLA
jgi:hypothetical protein